MSHSAEDTGYLYPSYIAHANPVSFHFPKLPQSSTMAVVTTTPATAGDSSSSPAETRKKTLRSYIWDADSHLKSPEERRLLLKLDLAILTIGCFGFFMKFLDQTNMISAYISGMREDLSMLGNEYTYATTAYTVGYAIMQVPSTLIVQKIPPSIWLGAMEVGWGVWTFAQAGLSSSSQLYAFRFLVGLFEASFSPVVLYVIGGWYTKTELAKRTTLFQITAPLGAAFSGYLQAAVYEGMDGRNGLAGWRWLYIICGLMTVPVGIATFFFFPNTPYKTKPWFLTEEEHAIALRRVQDVGIAPPAKITWRTFTRILGRWRIYAFVFGYVVSLAMPCGLLKYSADVSLSALRLLFPGRRFLRYLAQVRRLLSCRLECHSLGDLADLGLPLSDLGLSVGHY